MSPLKGGHLIWLTSEALALRLKLVPLHSCVSVVNEERCTSAIGGLWTDAALGSEESTVRGSLGLMEARDNRF